MEPILPNAGLYLAELELRGPLSAAGRDAVLALPSSRRAFGTYQDIVREGDRPGHCCFVETGFVSRYKILRSGARQIVSFHIPGDMVDLPSALVVITDHSIRAHAPTTIIATGHSDILQLSAEFPEIGRAFWFETLVDAAIFREWIVNVGRRNARERTAHLLLEFAYRFNAVGELKDDSFELPVSQLDLSDALGRTSVHLNRTLQWLRSERYIRTHSKSMTIENWPEMIRLASHSLIYIPRDQEWSLLLRLRAPPDASVARLSAIWRARRN